MKPQGSSRHIWLVGGTSESRAIAEALRDHGFPWIATVVAESARKLYVGLPGQVRSGLLTPETLPSWLSQESIAGIVDASHPFATAISQLAIASGLPYLRFERSRAELTARTRVLPQLDAVLNPCYLSGRRVLLTLGVKALARFAPWQRDVPPVVSGKESVPYRSCDRLWARVLPSKSSIEVAIAAGFPRDRLIPQKLPVTYEQERSLWQRLQVDTVVSKDSGDAGGLAIKQAVAADLNVRLIVIARPAIAYPQQTNQIAVVLEFCDRVLS